MSKQLTDFEIEVYYDLIEFLQTETDFEAFSSWVSIHGANFRLYNGNTPLYEACDYENYDYVDWLINNGAFINKKCHNGETALHMAARRDHNGHILELLLKNDADTDIMNDEEQTPLHIAAIYDNEVAARLLTDYGADPFNDKCGELPIDIALAADNSAIINIIGSYMDEIAYIEGDTETDLEELYNDADTQTEDNEFLSVSPSDIPNYVIEAIFPDNEEIEDDNDNSEEEEYEEDYEYSEEEDEEEDEYEEEAIIEIDPPKAHKLSGKVKFGIFVFSVAVSLAIAYFVPI